jgi:hypothetical protein
MAQNNCIARAMQPCVKAPDAKPGTDSEQVNMQPSAL